MIAADKVVHVGTTAPECKPGSICDQAGVYLSNCRCNAVLAISKGQPFPWCCDRREGTTTWTFHRRVGGLPSGENTDPRDPKRTR